MQSGLKSNFGEFRLAVQSFYCENTDLSRLVEINHITIYKIEKEKSRSRDVENYKSLVR